MDAFKHQLTVKRNSRTEKSPVDLSRSQCGARAGATPAQNYLTRMNSAASLLLGSTLVMSTIIYVIVYC